MDVIRPCRADRTGAKAPDLPLTVGNREDQAATQTPDPGMILARKQPERASTFWPHLSFLQDMQQQGRVIRMKAEPKSSGCLFGDPSLAQIRASRLSFFSPQPALENLRGSVGSCSERRPRCRVSV